MKTALSLTGNPADASDVAQEAYLKLVRHRGGLDELKNLRGWVYRITVNAARDLHRRNRKWAPLKEIAARMWPQDNATAAELRNRLSNALSHLSFNERAAFVFKDLHELETSEVAEILGCRPVTIRGYLHTARRKLRRQLSDLRRVK